MRYFEELKIKFPSSISNSRIKYFSRNALIGYIIAILAAAFAAIPDVIPKPLLEEDGLQGSLDPVMFVFLIYAISSLFFSAPFTKNKNPIRSIKAISIILLVLLGVAEASATLAYSIGLKETTASNAAVLGNSETIFTIFIGMMLLKERLKKSEILPFVVIIIGTAVFPVFSDLISHGMNFSDFLFGDSMIVLAGLFFCIGTFITKHVSEKIGSQRIMQIMSFSGGMFMFALLFIFQVPFEIDLAHLPLISIISICGIGLSGFCFIIALKLIGAVRTVLIFSANTVFGLIYSMAYLGETLTLFNLTSVILVIAGLYFLRTRISKDE